MIYQLDDANTKVISLTEARNKYRPGRCLHNHIEVDEELGTVLCTDCGEKLNPVAVLARFAKEETRWEQRREAAKAEQAKLDLRSRTKCQHCGQMTRISR